jgi:AraC-like DNA-binding protein
MTVTARILATGAGWQASEMRCDAGPADTPYEEQHDRICMAVVLEGTFGYRSSCGASILAPGAVLLGNPGDCFECGHQHSIGDRCLSFHFDPGFYEDILVDLGASARLNFDRPALPLHRRRGHLLPNADAVLDDPDAVEVFAYELAATIAQACCDDQQRRDPKRSSTKQIEELVHWIEQEFDQPLPLASLAQRACMSPYHLLREFKRVVGVPPHQFVLAQRLRRAAYLLRHSSDPILQIAIDAGFGALSEFNKRFRRVLGVSPRDFRTRGGFVSSRQGDSNANLPSMSVRRKRFQAKRVTARLKKTIKTKAGASALIPSKPRP